MRAGELLQRNDVMDWLDPAPWVDVDMLELSIFTGHAVYVRVFSVNRGGDPVTIAPTKHEQGGPRS